MKHKLKIDFFTMLIEVGAMCYHHDCANLLKKFI